MRFHIVHPHFVMPRYVCAHKVYGTRMCLFVRPSGTSISAPRVKFKCWYVFILFVNLPHFLDKYSSWSYGYGYLKGSDQYPSEGKAVYRIALQLDSYRPPPSFRLKYLYMDGEGIVAAAVISVVPPGTMNI